MTRVLRPFRAHLLARPHPGLHPGLFTFNRFAVASILCLIVLAALLAIPAAAQEKPAAGIQWKVPGGTFKLNVKLEPAASDWAPSVKAQAPEYLSEGYRLVLNWRTQRDHVRELTYEVSRTDGEPFKVVGVEVETSGDVAVAFVNASDYRRFPAVARPLFSGAIERRLARLPGLALAGNGLRGVGVLARNGVQERVIGMAAAQ